MQKLKRALYMTRERFTDMKHHIVGVTAEFLPEKVEELNRLLNEVAIKIPLKK